MANLKCGRIHAENGRARDDRSSRMPHLALSTFPMPNARMARLADAIGPAITSATRPSCVRPVGGHARRWMPSCPNRKAYCGHAAGIAPAESHNRASGFWTPAPLFLSVIARSRADLVGRESRGSRSPRAPGSCAGRRPRKAQKTRIGGIREGLVLRHHADQQERERHRPHHYRQHAG